jgi:hypothetical protein
VRRGSFWESPTLAARVAGLRTDERNISMRQGSPAGSLAGSTFFFSFFFDTKGCVLRRVGEGTEKQEEGSQIPAG